MRHLLVNGQAISEAEIQMEAERLSLDPNLKAIADERLRREQARNAAEHSLIGRALVEQVAIADPRPIDPDVIAKEVERQKVAGACRSAFDDGLLRMGIEKQLRVNRTLADLAAGAQRASDEDIRAFYETHGHNFRSPEMFHAAHIVKHVNENQTEQQAQAGIQAALQDLEAGESFAVVAERWSDCKGQGGDLGMFTRGTMVDEFDNVLLGLEPGQRSGIFVTPFGFHIAELRAKRPGGRMEFDVVRGDIERVMNTMAEHQAFLVAVNKLRMTATVQWEQDGDSARAAGAGQAP
jgi:hypothetical protein